MKLPLTFLSLICAGSLLTPAKAQDISLFNGRDLTGWAGLAGYWSVKDGAITGRVTGRNKSKGNTFLVWQGGDVADFDLSLKFKLTADNAEDLANSGIQFRASMADAARFSLKGYQAELDPGTHHPTDWLAMATVCGSLTEDGPGIMLAAVGQKVRVRQGETSRRRAPQDVLGSLGTDQSVATSYRKRDWNDCRIIAVGNRIQIFINGLQTVDAIDDGERFSKGLLGLQLHGMDREKMIQFKEIKLRPLASGVPASATVASATADIQTDPNQPRLEVLKEQGPNALEWALAPLGQPAPSDIRQNLTYLREDLLDESKRQSKASPAAYMLGSQLCDKLLLTIEERHQAEVQAGYTAAQADASVRVTSRSLEVSRNYKMSWPQYAREKDQRAEILRQQTSGADLKKEQIKVAWAVRTEALRKYLNDLYRQYREALR